MRVLVTGASGFIGRAVVRQALESGHIVASVSRGPLNYNTHQNYQYDLRTISPRRFLDDFEPGTVIHCAWDVSPAAMKDTDTQLQHLDISVALHKMCNLWGIRFVGVGSGFEMFPDSSPYARAKKMAQEVVEGPLSSWCRVFQVYGPGEAPDRLIPSAIARVRAGLPTSCSDGMQVRDFVHVEDAARAIVMVAERQVEGVIDICTGYGTLVRKAVWGVATELGRPGLAVFGSRPRRQGEPEHCVGDPSRLAGLGFRHRFDLWDGIKDTIKRTPT